MDIVRNFSRIAFGCAFPRAGKVLVLAAVCAFAYRANSEVCYYLPNGTGAWAEPSRWKNGKVPAENDTAEISDGTAYVTDADSEVVARVGAITLQSRTAVVEFNIESDFHVPNRIIGKGKIVKNGKGRLFLDAPYENFYHTTEGIEVNDGELYLVERPAGEIPGGQIESKHFVYGPLTVNAPGKLFLRPTGYSETCGISGDGVITNTSTTVWQLYFNTNETVKAGTAYSFSGILSPNIDPTFIGVERQDFLSVNPYSHSIRCTHGTVGVARFGNQGEAGSLGTARLGVQVNSTGIPFRFVYLGAGEKSTRQFRVFGANPGFVIDGGAFGGLEIAGDIYLTYGINKSQALILDGSNAAPCRLSGNILEAHNNKEFANVTDKISSTIVKRGSGTWQLAPILNFQGVVAVEGGVLEAEKIEEKGTYCSLGDSTIPLEPISGKAREDLREMPYAVLLGDGTLDGDQVGTLSYTGTKALDLYTRTIALSGAGRLRNSSEGLPFAWTGITSSGEGEHALHLDGAGTENRAISVTNGTGKITVVKEGLGTWTLDGDVDVSALDVRGGVLDVRQRQAWRFYRFNVKKLWGDSESSMVITRLAFFGEDKSCLNLGLVRNKKADGNIAKLEMGEVAFWKNVYEEGVNDDGSKRSIDNIFLENSQLCQIFQGNVTPSPDREDSWIRFVMRPIPGQSMVKYDICGATRGTKNDDKPNGRLPKIWTLDGSMDGVNWTEISAPAEDQPHAKYDEKPYLWVSSKTQDYRTGFAIPAGPEGGAIMSSVDSVAVSGGGTLNVSSPVTTARLRCDPAAGGGTVKGIVFAKSGVVELLNFAGGNTKTLLPVAFDGCDGVGNIAKWAVETDGRISSKMKVTVASDGKLFVTSIGMTVIVR